MWGDWEREWGEEDWLAGWCKSKAAVGGCKSLAALRIPAGFCQKQSDEIQIPLELQHSAVTTGDMGVLSEIERILAKTKWIFTMPECEEREGGRWRGRRREGGGEEGGEVGGSGTERWAARATACTWPKPWLTRGRRPPPSDLRRGTSWRS